MKIFTYTTKFSDNRGNFTDVVKAESMAEAELKIEEILRNYDDSTYGIDHDFDFDLMECSTDYESFVNER